MNEVLSQLHARKSVRAFLDRPISPEARRAILEAAAVFHQTNLRIWYI